MRIKTQRKSLAIVLPHNCKGRTNLLILKRCVLGSNLKVDRFNYVEKGRNNTCYTAKSINFVAMGVRYVFSCGISNAGSSVPASLI